MALPTVTVTGSRGGSGAGGGFGNSTNPGASISRGDPHGGFGTGQLDRVKTTVQKLKQQSSGLNVTDSTPASAPEPDASATEPLATVVVSTNAPTLSDVDPSQSQHIEDSRGQTIQPAPPYPGPRSTPLPLQGAPDKSFLGPQPEPLAEVVVEAEKPPAVPPRSVVPPSAAFGLPNPFALGLAFLLTPRVLNQGENERVRKQIERDLSLRLLPAVVSVTRLPDPVAEVTVRGTRISDRPAPRAARGVPSGALGLHLRPFDLGFLAKPTSVLKPKPQRRTKPRVVGSTEVSFNVGTVPISSFVEPINSYFAPTPRVSPKPLPLPFTPPDLVPGIGDLPPTLVGQPTLPIGIVQPIPTPAELAQPLPQFQGQCSCPQVQQKQKTKKRRRVRTRCYRGTFIEKGNRVNKQRLEEIPCNTDLRTKSGAQYRNKPKPRPKAQKKLQTPGLPPRK